MPDPDARIVLDPATLSGKPIVRGTRISVAHVLGLLAQGWDKATILEQHPTLTAADVAACLAHTPSPVAREREAERSEAG
jgi:uncharacterized protein (DUF433 family)